ncbi:MAG: hypothetical protein IT553_09810 [Sphingomonadaceae bacterium]|nr:hypothetical protein [Sphingomonadaceae bacterium]
MQPASPPTSPPFPPNSIHLVRTAMQMTMTLSQMADQKASILMGATFVVFTVSIGQASRTNFPIALGILALFAFLSALFAVAAVLPRVAPAQTMLDKPLEPNANILFFGVFSQMSEADFIENILARCRRDEDFLATMLRDIHQNGSMLARRKYRYLAIAYRIFIVGLTCSFAAFALQMLGWIGQP